MAEVTDLNVADCEVAPKLISSAPRSVNRIIGDGAYDTFDCYQSAYERQIDLLTPPRRGAIVGKKNESWSQARNQAVREIIGLGNDEDALKLWKKLKDYHKRSLVETTFSRLKGVFESKLFSQHADNQDVELMLKAQILNRLTRTGMPKGVMT